MPLPEIFKLSVPEKILLVEAIWDSIANEESKDNSYKLSDEQIGILEDEMEAYSKNPIEGASWDEIKKSLTSEDLTQPRMLRRR